MKKLLILITCVSLLLAGCNTGNSTDTVTVGNNDTSVEDTNDIETVSDNSTESVSDNSIEGVSDNSVETSTIDYSVYDKSFKGFKEEFNIEAPTLTIEGTDISIGVSTINDLLSNEVIGNKFLYLVGDKIIAPYHAVEYTINTDKFSDVTTGNITVYSYNLTGYYMPVKLLPIYGLTIGYSNNLLDYQFDTSVDQIESDTFEFYAGDDMGLNVRLTPSVELARMCIKDMYKNVVSTPVVDSTTFTVDETVYSFADLKYYMSIDGMVDYPCIIYDTDGTAITQRLAYDEVCSLVSYPDLDVRCIYPTLDVNDGMYNLYALPVQEVILFMDRNSEHSFVYEHFDSSEFDSSEFEWYDDSREVSIIIGDNIEGTLNLNRQADSEYFKQMSTFVVGSHE